MGNKSPRKITHKRLSTEQWQDIMSSYEQSGLTQEKFCMRESLAPSTFHSWRQRLNGANPVKAKKAAFIELMPPQNQPPSADWDIELALGENIVLRLRHSN